MLDFWSLFSCTAYRPLPVNDSPAPNEYLKSCFSNRVALYASYCNAAATTRSSKKWLISVVGAPEQKAVEILNAVYLGFKHKPKAELRWWSEAPLSDDCKNMSNGKWVGYDRENGAFDVPQIEFGARIILLYYSNGHDPSVVFKDIPEGEFMLHETERMLIPVSDYLFDKSSCETVICSEYCPLYDIKSDGSHHYSPIPITRLIGPFVSCLLQKGGKIRTLGEMNSSYRSHNKKRFERWVAKE